MSSIAIFGKGFGLYGYLPAVIESKKYSSIFILEKYKEFLLSRDDIKHYYKDLSFCKEEDILAGNCEELILCRRPIDNFKIISKIKKFKKLFLEKPIAESPIQAYNLLNLIQKKCDIFSTNYTFLILNWYEILSKNFDKDIEIEWNFKAHHNLYKISNWKTKKEFGGSLISFYGIHFIALAASLNFKICKFSRIINESYWECILNSENNRSLKIKINCDSNKNFYSITANQKNILLIKDPFSKEVINRNLLKNDIRCSILLRYLLLEEDKKKLLSSLNFNNEVLDLWQKIINFSNF